MRKAIKALGTSDRREAARYDNQDFAGLRAAISASQPLIHQSARPVKRPPPVHVDLAAESFGHSADLHVEGRNQVPVKGSGPINIRLMGLFELDRENNLSTTARLILMVVQTVVFIFIVFDAVSAFGTLAAQSEQISRFYG